MTARNAALTALALPLIPVALMAVLAAGVLAVVHALTFGGARRLGMADRSESTLPLWLALAGVEAAAEAEPVAPVAPAVEQAQDASQVTEPAVVAEPGVEVAAQVEPATLTATFEPGDGSPEAVKAIADRVAEADTRTDAEVLAEADATGKPVDARPARKPRQPSKGKTVAQAVEKPARAPRKPRRAATA